MAAYSLNIDSVLQWTPSQLRALHDAREERERAERHWEIAIASIPNCGEPKQYVDRLLAILDGDSAIGVSGAPRLDQMTDEELARIGAYVVTPEDTTAE